MPDWRREQPVAWIWSRWERSMGLEKLLLLGFHDRQVEPTVTVSN